MLVSYFRLELLVAVAELTAAAPRGQFGMVLDPHDRMQAIPGSMQREETEQQGRSEIAMSNQSGAYRTRQ